MSNLLATQTFDFVTGQPHAADRQLSVSNRMGGSLPVVQVTSALSPPFTVEATKMCATSGAVATVWNALRARIGFSDAAEFDTGVEINQLLLLAVGQPLVRQLAGCSPNIRATFTLTFRSHQAAQTAVLGESGLTG